MPFARGSRPATAPAGWHKLLQGEAAAGGVADPLEQACPGGAHNGALLQPQDGQRVRGPGRAPGALHTRAKGAGDRVGC